MYIVGLTHPFGPFDVFGFANDLDAAIKMVDACAYDIICKADGEYRAENRFTKPQLAGTYIITETETEFQMRCKTTKTIQEAGWFGTTTQLKDEDHIIGWITASLIDPNTLRKDSCWIPNSEPSSKTSVKYSHQRQTQPWMEELTARIQRKIKDE